MITRVHWWRGSRGLCVCGGGGGGVVGVRVYRQRKGIGGVGTTPFWGANVIHYLYKLSGKRSMQKRNFLKSNI